MREIEVKARLRDKQLFLKRTAAKKIYFGKPAIQDDITYETTLPYDDPGWNIFRIRKQGNRAILTMKYKASSRSRDNHERETEISDHEQVADMLERIGYSYGVHVHKSRRTAKYNGLELCLDEIDKLGTFVEVEKLTNDGTDVDAVQSELWNLLLDLGVNPDDRVYRGYDTLMHKLIKSKKNP